MLHSYYDFPQLSRQLHIKYTTNPLFFILQILYVSCDFSVLETNSQQQLHGFLL